MAPYHFISSPLERKYPRFRHRGHPPPSEHPPGGHGHGGQPNYYNVLPGYGGFTVSLPRNQQQRQTQYLLPQQRHYQRQTGGGIGGQQQGYQQPGRYGQQQPPILTR